MKRKLRTASLPLLIAPAGALLSAPVTAPARDAIRRHERAAAPPRLQERLAASLPLLIAPVGALLSAPVTAPARVAIRRHERAAASPQLQERLA